MLFLADAVAATSDLGRLVYDAILGELPILNLTVSNN